MISEVSILEGHISVEAALLYNSRDIKLCYVDSSKLKKRDRKTLYLLKLLKEKSIPVEICEREVIDAFLEENSEDHGSSHGGVVAICGERNFLSFDKLLQKAESDGGFVIMLDGVEDPFNLGYSLRNLYASGCSGVILPKRNPLVSAGVCARASAGASEMLDIAIMPDLEGAEEQKAFINKLKKTGFYTVCAAKTKDCEDIFSFEPQYPLILFIGGEKRGISPAFVENCDSIVAIPYFSDAKFSLPTSSTAALFGFELARKK